MKIKEFILTTISSSYPNEVGQTIQSVQSVCLDPKRDINK